MDSPEKRCHDLRRIPDASYCLFHQPSPVVSSVTLRQQTWRVMRIVPVAFSRSKVTLGVWRDAFVEPNMPTSHHWWWPEVPVKTAEAGFRQNMAAVIIGKFLSAGFRIPDLSSIHSSGRAVIWDRLDAGSLRSHLSLRASSKASINPIQNWPANDLVLPSSYFRKTSYKPVHTDLVLYTPYSSKSNTPWTPVHLRTRTK